MALAQSLPLRPVDLLITEQLETRPDRPTDLVAENTFLYELSVLMARSPRQVMQSLLEAAMKLTGTESAGVSMVRINDCGAEVLYRYAVVGVLSPFTGSGVLRDSSVSGICLDHDAPILIQRPARVFECYEIDPPIEESLLVPLYDAEKAQVGTLWVIHHKPEGKFCASDLHLMKRLAGLAEHALRLVREEQERHEEMWATEANLSAERMRRELAEQKSEMTDTIIREVNHRVKNTIQMTSSLLSLQSRSVKAPEAKAALLEALSRLAALQGVHELLYRNASNAQEVEMDVLLKELTHGLEVSHPEYKGRVTIALHTDPVTLDAHQAIPLALIVNEAVTNSYKHAFPQNSGTINVSLHERAHKLALEIRDDGIGMPETIEESRMGLKLVRSLASRAGATLDLAPIDGKGVGLTLTAPMVTRPMLRD